MGAVRLETMTMKIPAGDVKPGVLATIFGEQFRLRYITYHNVGSVTLRFQPGDEPLSPFTENDVLTMTVPRTFEVEVDTDGR
ncbi:hypothetical protein EAN16_20950 [Salmonella enterica]|uniref:Uncharacterized protein n=6 Tax=Chivirus TaxID=1623283 RepID=A0A3G1L2Y4_9CAUD|nr:hypothetical protein HWB38_gp47 [Salmonella phage KFS-SE1]EAA4270096.1 hypothetical protein [Salmonella enterica subsp. enterica serovar Altona]EAA4391993.1 hypothetical protein [Salmonella enterica subsp. enterica serovar Adjame]EAM4232816.1 hypothetical protein [Salmonella enterica]EBW6887634.1 hypothetical protein [Salmonella enterica subsp. enterica serovar Mikawasima]EBY8848294.1 hypothetical protein [Salmonella enterica subsp. enterica serovar Typhimurium]EBZ0828384.1 hypothetical pr